MNSPSALSHLWLLKSVIISGTQLAFPYTKGLSFPAADVVYEVVKPTHRWRCHSLGWDAGLSKKEDVS